MSHWSRLLGLVGIGVLLAAPGAGQDVPVVDPLLDPAPDAVAVDAQETTTEFEALFRAYRGAHQAGDAPAAAATLQRIRRLRAERNIGSLRDVALALSGLGLRTLPDDPDTARLLFEEAATLDPHLPDAHLGLARTGGVAELATGNLAAFLSRVAPSQGRYRLAYLLLTGLLLAAFATTVVFALVQVLRVGPLLRHDLEESLGPQRPGIWATGAYALLLLLPLVALQGYAWVPLWWLGLLFLYMGKLDRAISFALVLVWLVVGSAVQVVEPLLVASGNPLLQASLRTAQLGADPVAAATLEQAVADHPEDRDLAYLLAQQHKKAGRYAEAAAVYETLLAAAASDRVALNNLGNLEFLRGEFPGAKAHYDQAAQSGSAAFRATAYYNKSIAELQEFDFDPAKATRAQADRIAPGLPAEYERRWHFEQEGSVVPAVVDLGPTSEELWAKFVGAAEGVVRENVTGSGAAPIPGNAFVSGLRSRFLAFPVVFGLVVFALSRWRGERLFTLRCLKCGTPFCKLCHLGTPQSELCTQCHHLFVVRDGVSAPARNRKMAEVAKEEVRRRRVFRLLSLVSPGAGHVHARRPLLGIVLAGVWYGVLGVAVAALLVPVVASPGRFANPLVLGLFGTLLLAVFLVANLAVPSFEARISFARRGARRPQAGRRS